MNSARILPFQLFIGFAVLSVATAVRAAQDPIAAVVNLGQNVVAFRLPTAVVMQSALDAAPLWPEDEPNPPLPARRAMTLAREALLKFQPESGKWKLRGLDLTQVGQKGQWMYIVRFEIPNDSPYMIPAPYDVVVLMNGHVVEPAPRLLSENISTFFGFDDASVQSVLQYYSDLSGKELVIDHEVSAKSKMTIMKRTLTQTEALALLERELRNQAGLLLTPTDDKRVAVTSAARTAH
jgi:hypothetical protein